MTIEMIIDSLKTDMETEPDGSLNSEDPLSLCNSSEDPLSLCNSLEELEELERSRFVLGMALSAIQEAKQCHGCCGALRAMTSETLANDQEIRESRKWEPLEPLPYYQELDRVNREQPIRKLRVKRKQWMSINPLTSRFPGKIHFRRLLKRPANLVHSFREESKKSSERILKKLRGKPASVAEIRYKLKKEKDDKILYFLSDFLQLPEVKESGVNKENVEQSLSYVGLLMILNLASTSSPLRVVANPAQKSKTGYQQNDNIGAGGAYVERIRSLFLRLRLNPIATLGDISNFYLRVKLDVLGTLSGAVWLQRDEDGQAVCNIPAGVLGYRFLNATHYKGRRGRGGETLWIV
jgi:hypothetical protein